MADINNDDEKIEPRESRDPSAATGAVDLNAVSMDKQGSEDIPEKDEYESLTDEDMEQPPGDSEPASIPAEPEEAIVAADQPEEEPPAEEPEAAVAEEEPVSIPAEPEEAIVAADQPEEEQSAEEPEAAVAEEEPAKQESTSSLGPQPIRSSKLLTAALLLSIVAVISAAAGFYFRMLNVELDGLRQQIETTGQATVAAPAENTSGELDRLNKRIEELGARLEVYGQSVKFTGEDWGTAKARIERIEQSINSMLMSQKTDVLAPPQTTTAMVPNHAKTESPPALRKGDWIVNLESHINENDADRLLEFYRSKGLPVEKFSVKSNGMSWHRLRVTGFSSAEEAKGYIKSTAGRQGFPYAWVERISLL